LTLSNGRGPVDTHQDFDHNKAVGGRPYLRQDAGRFRTVTLGTSGYRGKYTTRHAEFGLAADGTPASRRHGGPSGAASPPTFENCGYYALVALRHRSSGSSFAPRGATRES
jgi:hypothetical protein